MSIKSRIKRALFGFLHKEIEQQYKSTFASSTIKVEQAPFEVLRFEGKVSLSHIPYGQDARVYFEQELESAKHDLLQEVAKYIEVETAELLDPAHAFDRSIRMKITIKDPR